MSVDITALSIAVSSTGIREASSALGGLSTSAANTEKRISALIETMKRLQSVTGTINVVAGSSAALTAALTALNNTLSMLNQRTTQADQSQRRHNEGMREAHGLARGLSGAFGALWVTYGNLMGMSVGVALGASLRGIIQTGMEVEKQLNFVYALSKENKAVDLGSFLRITESSVQSITDAANAMRSLAQNGLSVAESLSALPSILNLATVGEMNVGQAAIAATGAVSAFGLEMSDIERVSDIFAKTAATSNTSVLAMTESMKQASTAASLFKVSIEETAAMLGLLAKINITGGAAGTSFTNMLTGLYEPTEQAKKAMIRLGVSAFDATGKMKNVTVLLEDIKRASSSLNDKDKTDIFGAMVTTRGLKSLTLAIDNIDTFKSKTKDATEALGFMKGVVAKLEDDSAHAFTRMGVIIQSEFVRAFMDAAPEVQKLGQALGDLFKSNGAERKNTITGEMEKETTAIANLFKNLVIVANALVEHIGLVTSAVAAYALWRMAIGYTVVQQTALGASTVTLGAVYGTWRTAVIAATAAQALAAAATAAHTAATLAGGSTMTLMTAITEANTVATAANTVAQRAMMAFLLPAMGFLAVAVAGAAALWLVFRDNTDDASDANTKMSNSIHVIKEQLDKEIERLERSLELWDERKKRFNDPTAVSPQKMEEAQATMAALDEQMEKLLGRKVDDSEITQAFAASFQPTRQLGREIGKLAYAYLIARDNLKLLQDMQGKSAKVVVDKSIEAVFKDFDKLREQLEKYKGEASQIGSKGKDDYLIANPKERALRESAQNILDLMDKINMSKTMGKAQIEGASKLINQARVDFQKLQEEVSNSKNPSAVPVPKAAAADALQGKLNSYQAEIKAAKREGEEAKAEAQSLYAQGKMGELGLIEKIRNAEVNKQADIADAADKKLVLLSKQVNQEAAIANARAEIMAALAATETANATAKRSAAEVEIKNGQRLLKFESDKYEAMNNYEMAYRAQFKGKNDTEISQLRADIKAQTDEKKKGLLTQLADEMEAANNSGLAKAKNRDAVNAFNIEVESVRNTLKSVQTSTEGQGLAAMFDAATAASAKYRAALADLEQKKGITDPKGLVEAQANLNNLAENQRKMWVGVGESISDSLENAFGNAGKAAGNLLKVAVNYNNLENKSGAARVKAFGDAAGAAKGFFKEGTTGYKVMESAERAFRMIELAGQARSLAVTVTNAVATAAAWAPAVFMSFMAKLGPWGMAAAGLAMAAIGVSASRGGDSGENAESRQKSQGTGSVLGSDDKSNSIANSIEILAKNSGLGLAHSASMVGYLRFVSDNIKGLASVVVGRNTGITSGPADKVATTLGGKISNSIFGGNRTTVDSGISVASTSLSSILNGGGMRANQYADVKKDGGAFHRDKIIPQITALGAETSAQFSKIIVGMADTLKAASKDLGLGGDDFDRKLSGFVVSIGKISLKGLSGDAAQKELEAVFSKLGDDMAKFSIGGLSQFQKIGEGYLETVMRVANSLIQVKDVFAVLGKTFDLTGAAAISVSEGLIAAAGGLEELTSGTKFFVDNFLTEADKMGPITNSVTKRLKELGVSELTTIELYKKKVRALDLTNAEDQKLYANLIELAPVFKEAADYAAKLAEGTVELTKAQQEALDNIEKARANLQRAYDSESSALQSTIDKTKTYVQTLKDFQNSLKLGANSPLTNVEKYAEAKSQLTTVGAAAQGGDVVAQQKFTSIANEFLNASRVVNASGDAFTTDFNKVQTLTSSLADAALGQIDVATASLAALNKQVEGLLTIDKSVMSVTKAITELRLAIEVGKTVGVSDPGSPGPTAAQFDSMMFAMHANTAAIGELKASGQVVGAKIAEVVMDSSQENAEATVTGFKNYKSNSITYA